MIDKSKLYGVDVDNEISLFEYGLLVTPYDKDGQKDEYFVVYHIGNNNFDTGYKQEYELNNLIKGTDWANQKDINNFLEYVGQTKEEWLKLPFVKKLSDCLSYWGYENVMGTCYHSINADKAKELYL